VVTRARAFNPQVCLEVICCAVFSALVFYITVSGKYLTYVTPRMAPYLYFTAVVMLLWAVAGVFRLFRPQNRVRAAHCFVPAIPILLLLLPHNPLSASDLSFGYAVPAVGTDAAAGFVNDPSAWDAETPIEIGDDEFYSWLNELYTNLDMYEGRRIAVTGFVFKDPEMFGADEFVPARLGMTCCAADLVPYGLVCRYDKAGELEADAWVRVEGVLQRGEYDGAEEPQIAVTSVEPAAPVEGYIYPFEY
jgi:putative membrane protein